MVGQPWVPGMVTTVHGGGNPSRWRDNPSPWGGDPGPWRGDRGQTPGLVSPRGDRPTWLNLSTSSRHRLQGVGFLVASPGDSSVRSSSPSTAGAGGRMAGRRGQRCGTRPHGHWPRSSGNRPSAPASGRPPARKSRPFPGLLDGAGRGPAPRQPFHRYWSAGPTPSPCGPIRARHERRPIGRPRVSVPAGRRVGNRGRGDPSPPLAPASPLHRPRRPSLLRSERAPAATAAGV